MLCIVRTASCFLFSPGGGPQCKLVAGGEISDLSKWSVPVKFLFRKIIKGGAYVFLQAVSRGLFPGKPPARDRYVLSGGVFPDFHFGKGQAAFFGSFCKIKSEAAEFFPVCLQDAFSKLLLENGGFQ